jgi:hypothetical protein
MMSNTSWLTISEAQMVGEFKVKLRFLSFDRKKPPFALDFGEGFDGVFGEV